MNAIITGATKGIGLAIAKTFTSHQINLVLNSRSQSDLDNLKEEITKNHPGIEVHTYEADLSIKEQTKALGDFCLEKLDSIDILINNAGVFIPGETHKEEEGSLEKMIETNLYSAYYLSQKVIPKMIEQKSGHIFNMCSIASKIAYPNGGSYSISKFALLGFSKVLREELKDYGIKVTSILPGATWSNSWAGVELPESRLMQANDIALAVYSAVQMSPSAVVEEIVLRPQLGDL
jgi:short-subunit dehydrogenase